MKKEMLMETSHLNKINRFTTIDTGIYIEGELVKFQETKLFNNQIGIALPVTFENMDSNEIRKKYFAEQRPQIIKTNEDGSINFSFSLIDRKVDAEQLGTVVQEFERVLKRYRPMSVCLENGSEKGLVPCAWIEFISSALNDNLYNMLTVYSIGNQVLLVMFNCPFEKQKDWFKCLSQIRKSIVIYNQ